MSEHTRMTASFVLMSSARMRRLPSIPVLTRLRQTAGITAALLTAMLVMIAGAARARSHPEFVMVGKTPPQCTGRRRPAPHVAILYENGLSVPHPMCTEMAKRGFMTLCVIEFSHRRLMGERGPRCESRRQIPPQPAWDHQGCALRSQRWRRDSQLLPSGRRERRGLLPGIPRSSPRAAINWPVCHRQMACYSRTLTPASG